MTKKQRLIGIIDNSSYGFSIGSSQMEISQQCEMKIRRMLKACPIATCVEGDELHGNCVYNIDIKEESLGRYEFKQQGQSRFVNVTTNPSRLASGNNDIPILLTGTEKMYLRRDDANAALTTFMYLNRLPYILLERLPSNKPFTWT